MRNAVVDREFQHLRIDHDQPAFLRLQPIEQADDHRVDGDRLARAGGAGDQQMRHLGEIDDDRLAADRLAERDGELVLRALEILGGEQFAQEHRLAALIRQLDADRVAALHDGDAGGNRRHRARDVVGEPDDARRFDARRRLELIERDDRAGAHVDDLALDAEILEHAFEQTGVLLQRVLGDFGRRVLLRLGEHGERRELELFIAEQRELGFGQRALAGLQRPRRRRHAGNRDLGLRRGRGDASGRTAQRGDDRRQVRRPGGARRGRRDGLRRRIFDRRREFRAVAVEPGRTQRRARGYFGPAGEHPAHRALDHQRGVDQGAERHQAKTHFAGVVVLIRIGDVAGAARRRLDFLRLFPAFDALGADGGAERQDRRRDHRSADDHHLDVRSVREVARQRQQRVACDAAETGRQRPSPGNGSQRGGSQAAGETDKRERQPQPHPLQPAQREQPPAPERRNREQQRAAEAEKLHHQIGGDGAGAAEPVVSRRRRRMVEARIARRPGEQRNRTCRNADQQRHADDFRDTALRKLAQRVRQIVDEGEGRGTHGAGLGPAQLDGTALAPEPRPRQLMAA